MESPKPTLTYNPSKKGLEQLNEPGDLRDLVPDLIPYLQPDERVINVEYPPIIHPTKYPSAVQALDQLTGAEYDSQIGEFGPSVAAGVTTQNAEVDELHLFEVLFGRDSLRVALDLLDRYPKLARATILRLSELQGISTNPHSGEEPGRIIHEYRDPATDPIARQLTAEKGWAWPYYESIDATPMYISLVKRYCKLVGNEILAQKFTGRDHKSHQVGEAFTASVDWLTSRLERQPEGLLEYRRLMGIAAETWKDSWDSFTHKDGSIANHDFGVAAVEIQALAYDALLDAARVYENGLPDEERAQQLRYLAAGLESQIKERFWVDDNLGGYFVIGLDRDTQGQLRQLDTQASDMGHLLNSRLLDGDEHQTVKRREAVIRHLFGPNLLSVSGIRTLSKAERRFSPGGYHTGSVWIWDTYYIAQGLEREGYYGLSQNLKERIWRVVDVTRKFPEFARGGDEPKPVLTDRIVDVETGTGFRYRLEQPPQEIQGWTVAAIMASKSKHDPAHPDKLVPKQAQDPTKREFEQDILKHLPH